MRPPGFWARSPRHPLAVLLAPVGAAYGIASSARMDRRGHSADCPVLCIGNFTLGGAGKTPTALRVAEILKDLGARPAFLSRGYGGRAKGPLIVDPEIHGAEEVGDEPLLLARQALTVVARDRPEGAKLCIESGANIVVMDDGLQNPSLRKDFSFAVVDAGAGIGNGLTFPAGPLRMPLQRQWPHIGGIILIGDGAPGETMAREAGRRGLAVYRAHLCPRTRDLAGKAVLAFAGIGRPTKFFSTLREIGAEIVAERTFPDHHRYRRTEIAKLHSDARELGAILVTTEKDIVRLPQEYRGDVAILAVKLEFVDDAALRTQLAALLQVKRSSS